MLTPTSVATGLSLVPDNLSSDDLEDAVVGGIADVNLASLRMNAHAMRAIEFRLFGVFADAGSAAFPRAGYECHHFCAGIVTNDPVILGIGDEDRAIPVNAQVFRTIETGLPGRTQGCSRFSCTGDSADGAVGQYDTQRMTGAFEYPDTAVFVRDGSAWVHQRLLGCPLTVRRNSALTVPRNGADRAADQVNFANSAITQVGRDQPFAVGMQCDAIHLVELRLAGWAPVSCETRLAIARQSSKRHGFGIIDPNAVVERVGDVDSAIRRDGQTVRPIEESGPCRSPIAAVATPAFRSCHGNNFSISGEHSQSVSWLHFHEEGDIVMELDAERFDELCLEGQAAVSSFSTTSNEDDFVRPDWANRRK